MRNLRMAGIFELTGSKQGPTGIYVQIELSEQGNVSGIPSGI